ncbi:MAG: bifunctional oligoribonuclease/PAP phosphatase NrnA [Candidatus Omnitrophica bacterium]|nr:bifunctional oligoribonuclease/PAP phosphatase NrnA [Candidatus Omnitrophota bacterium]
MSAKKVIKAIRQYRGFLISSHIDLEGDALGSELALASLLRKLGKRVAIVNSDAYPANYSFLPNIKSIKQNIKSDQFQAALIIDCADKYRIGRIIELIGKEKPMINIDHHIGNTNFGQINWVEPQVSSAAELVYRLFKLTRTKLDRGDALAIYTAILTDTGGFRHCNTSSFTLQIASELLKFGLRPDEIYSKIYEGNLRQDVTLLAKLLKGMSFAASSQIAWVKIAPVELSRIKQRPEILDKILDLAKSIQTVKVVVIFSQNNFRRFKLSFRSKSPIDVQRIARRFGGGGHKYAAGCIMQGSFQQVKSTILTAIKKSLDGRHSYR